MGNWLSQIHMDSH